MPINRLQYVSDEIQLYAFEAALKDGWIVYEVQITKDGGRVELVRHDRTEIIECGLACANKAREAMERAIG